MTSVEVDRKLETNQGSRKFVDVLGFFFSTIGLIWIVTACCYQADSWTPWADCDSTSNKDIIDENSCRTTKAFLCLAIAFVWLALMWDRRHKFFDAAEGGTFGHSVTGGIYRESREKSYILCS